MRLKSIEAMRFIFMLIICLWHYQSKYTVMTRGYLAVEFFFILSGVLIYRSYDKKNSPSPLDYSARKFKRFTPQYLGGLLISFLILSLIPNILYHHYTSILSDSLKIIPEIFMLQNMGFYSGGINYPLWYLCVLVIGGGLVYSLLYYKKEIVLNLYLPVLIILGYTYMAAEGKDTGFNSFNRIGAIYIPMLRGVTNLSLGVVIGYILKEKKDFFKRNRVLIQILTLISLPLALSLHFTLIPNDTYALIFFSLLIIGCMTEGSIMERIFNHRIWLTLGDLTFSMLVLHASLIYICRHAITPFVNSTFLRVAIYYSGLIIISYFFNLLFKKRVSGSIFK